MKLKKIAKDLISQWGKDKAIKHCDRNLEFYNKFINPEKDKYILMWKEIKQLIEND
jgi:hypothetical protein